MADALDAWLNDTPKKTGPDALDKWLGLPMLSAHANKPGIYEPSRKRYAPSGRQAYEPPTEGTPETTEGAKKAAGVITGLVAGPAATTTLGAIFGPLLAGTSRTVQTLGTIGENVGGGIAGTLSARTVMGEKPTKEDLTWDVGLGTVLGAPLGYLRAGANAAKATLPLTEESLKSLDEVAGWLPKTEMEAYGKIRGITRTAATRATRDILRKKVGARAGEFTLQAVQRRVGEDPANFRFLLRRAISAGNRSPNYTAKELDQVWENLPVLYDGLARLDTGLKLGRDARQGIRRFVTMASRSETEALTRDTAFGAAGPTMAEAIENLNGLQDHMRAGAFDHVDNILRGFNRSQRRLVGRILANDLSLSPSHPRYKEISGAVSELRELYKTFADSAAELGIKTYDPLLQEMRPFMPQDFYFPTYYKPGAVKALFATGGPQLEDALGKVKRLFKISGPNWREQALKRLQSVLLQGEDTNLAASIRDRNLNFSKILDIPVAREWDAGVTTKRYILSASNRLAAAKIFGPNDELFYLMRNAVQKDGGDVDRFTTIFNNVTGRRYDNYDGIARLIRGAVAWGSFHVGTGILQFSQVIPTIAIHGLRNTIKGAFTYLSNPETREAVKRAAAMLPTSSMAETELSGVAMKAFMRATLIEPVDKGVRGFGALAGLLNASDIAARYARGGERAAEMARRLKKYGIDAADLLPGGNLTEGQAAQAIYYGANRASFASRPSDLPEYAHSHKIMYILRRFSAQSWQSMKNDVLREAQLWAKTGGKRGDIKPLLRLGVVAPIVAPLIRYGQDIVSGKQPNLRDVSIVKLLTGEDRVLSAVEAYEAAAAIGMFGMWGDALRQGTNVGPEELVGGAAGAGLTIPAEGAYIGGLYINAAVKGSQKSLRAANRRTARHITYFGRVISNQLPK